MSNIASIEDAFGFIREEFAKEQKRIGCELNERANGAIVKVERGNCKYGSRGVKTKKNDYRDFYWLSIRIQSRMYWITLFYNDVDSKSGNFHTQIGRIQFWKNIRCWEVGIGTPHRKTENKHWYFCGENSFDPKLRIGTETYSAELVVEKFLAFLEKNGETNIRK